MFSFNTVGAMTGGMSGGTFFDTMWAIFPWLFGAVVVLIVVIVIANVRRARKHGLNPMTMQTDVAARFIKDGVGGSNEGLTDRLVELDRLRAAGAISEQEYAAARSSALNGDGGR
tara:strand:- start:105 stop:449 length:345 start_codon:yes stop_codon:yes gene_type:complete